MTLPELAEELKKELETTFATVRITAIQNAEQFLTELRAINPGRLPGVLIVYEGTSFTDTNTIRNEQICLCLVDRFHADSDDRALRLFEGIEKLLALYPPEGRMIREEAFVTPEDVQASSPATDFAAAAIGLRVQWGI